MTELAKQIEEHETLLDYELNAWATAMAKGSYQTSERALETAAQHAAIVTALRARASQAHPQ